MENTAFVVASNWDSEWILWIEVYRSKEELVDGLTRDQIDNYALLTFEGVGGGEVPPAIVEVLRNEVHNALGDLLSCVRRGYGPTQTQQETFCLHGVSYMVRMARIV